MNSQRTIIYKGSMAAGAVMLALGATADPNVTITGVAQRWPWNNKVDISYTVSGGQSRADGVYCGLRFTLTANGATHAIEGSSIGASAENGSHVVTWDAPQGIVTTTGAMSATLFSTNVPSGNDYMVIDLSSGAVTYEGLFATQGESNLRYNTADYKTDKLVLRKVPKTADSASLPNGPFATGYATGGNNISSNTRTTWTTDRDYYIGVFSVTQYQYEKLFGSNPSGCKTAATGDVVAHRPVERVSWNQLRVEGTLSTHPVPVATVANYGTFLQRLNYITGNKFGFDLPTEIMHEIATRAGTTTSYFWGDSTGASYSEISLYARGSSDSNNRLTSTEAVGSRLPNPWGLYDMVGNSTDWCLDAYDSADAIDPAQRLDAFTPAWVEGSTNARIRNAAYNTPLGWANFKSASGNYATRDNAGASTCGFRVARIVR